MQDIQIFPRQATDNKTIIEIMKFLSNYFSPETIEFAEGKIPTLQGFVAKYKNDIIGFITFETIDKFKAKIYWMRIIPSYQHQGIGSMLLQQTESTLITQGIKAIELLTLDKHPDYPGYLFTRNFYKKYGFEISDFYMEEDIKILTMTKIISKISSIHDLYTVQSKSKSRLLSKLPSFPALFQTLKIYKPPLESHYSPAYRVQSIIQGLQMMVSILNI